MTVKEGEKYGKLTAIKIIGRAVNKNLIWECLCDCGNLINVPTGSLVTGNTRSCGCLLSESKRKAGLLSRKLNRYDLSGSFGIGYDENEHSFYFDLEDYDLIKEYTWSVSSEGYVVSRPFGKTLRMHMLVMHSDGSKPVDHIFHINYDNRKSELRICEHFENIINSKEYTNNTSGRKGVYWDKSRDRWMASITYNNKTIPLGRYLEYDDAVKAREIAEREYHKEFSSELK